PTCGDTQRGMRVWGRFEPRSAEPLDRPACVAQRDAEAAGPGLSKRADRKVAPSGLARPPQCDQLSGGLPEIRIAEQDGVGIAELTDRGLGRSGEVPPLAVR